MTSIYLIRHCEAEGNLYRRVQGQVNGLPTPRGRRQIAALAERFREIPLDALYSSDLSRAVETAGAITKYHKLRLVTSPLLREISMGVWEDVPWGNVEYDQPEQLSYFSHDPDRWQVEGAESFSDLRRRFVPAVLELAERHDGQTIAVVSHGMAIRTLLCFAMGLPSGETMKVAHADNTAVSLLRVEGKKIEIVYANDNSHLDENTSTFAVQSWWREKSGSDRNNLRFTPLDPARDMDLYISCYGDAWESAHGTRRGFFGRGYWDSAKKHMEHSPQSVMLALRGDEFAGLIDLSPGRGLADNAGWISLCYLVPEMRGLRFGYQLLGHAVSFFRGEGRSALRLHVAESNTRAIAFYEHSGFSVTGGEAGALGRLYTMEMKL